MGSTEKIVYQLAGGLSDESRESKKSSRHRDELRIMRGQVTNAHPNGYYDVTVTSASGAAGETLTYLPNWGPAALAVDDRVVIIRPPQGRPFIFSGGGGSGDYDDIGIAGNITFFSG